MIEVALGIDFARVDFYTCFELDIQWHPLCWKLKINHCRGIYTMKLANTNQFFFFRGQLVVYY